MPGDTTACETGSSRSEEDGNAAEMEERAYVKDEEPIHTKRRSRLSVNVSWGGSGKHGVLSSSDRYRLYLKWVMGRGRGRYHRNQHDIILYDIRKLVILYSKL